MTRILAWLAVPLLLVGIGAWYFYAPPEVRATERLLSGIRSAVATQNREKVGAALNDALAAEAKITLNVAGASQTMNREEFTRLVDLTLYSLHDYTLDTTLQSLKGTAAVLHVRARAQGTDYAGGLAIQARFAVEGDCDATLAFDAHTPPKLQAANCALNLRIAPK